ncbi:MAG: OmpA family protein [Burkholderiales bacterium]|nr:OmpA family protein [Burkholderiales bacterium]
MNKTAKQITLALSAAVMLSMGATGVYAQDNGYAVASDKEVVKNPFGLCWRTGYWTPAMATTECDPDLVPKKPMAAPAPAPMAAPAPAPMAAPVAKPAPKAVVEKVTMAADTHFDFDKSALKPEGKARLDDLVGKLKAVNLEVIIAIGHTDSIGSKAYNQKLSVRRANSVKAYLVSKGIEANRIYTEGKGETQPVADNRTKQGRAKNRRVEIEVVGTRER